MQDLIYADTVEDYTSLRALFRVNFPDADIKDQSDYIHEHRFSVEMDINMRKYVNWLIDNDAIGCSLCGNMYLLHKPKKEECHV